MAAERVIRDQYDEMTGPVLVAELGKRELNVSGKVEELRERLRADDAEQAQKAAAGPDDDSEGKETDEADVEVPEPREPLRVQPYGVRLTEEQARVLNRGEERFLQFTKHVNKVTSIKYAAGDQVMALGSPESTHVRVLPFGIEIELDSGQQSEG